MKVCKSMLQFSFLINPMYFLYFCCLLLGTFLVQLMDFFLLKI